MSESKKEVLSEDEMDNINGGGNSEELLDHISGFFTPTNSNSGSAVKGSNTTVGLISIGGGKPTTSSPLPTTLSSIIGKPKTGTSNTTGIIGVVKDVDSK